MQRRNFLKLTSGSLLCGGASAWAREPITRSGPARFQLGLAAYSLRDYFSFMKGKRREPAADGQAIDMRGFLDYCVRQQVKAAELTSYFFPPDAGEEYFRQLKHEAYIRGVTISGTAIGNNFTVGPGERLQREVDAAKQWIDHAAVLGAPHIRFFAGTGKQLAENPERLGQAADAINDCAQHAARRGIFLGIENHGGLTSPQMLEIMNRVDSEWVGINLDTGNFISEDPYADLRACVDYAVNVQVKVDMKTPEGKRHPADLQRIGKILRESGYQGFVILEYEDDSPYENVPATLDQLREALGMG